MGIKGQGEGERPFITVSSTPSPSRSQDRKLEYRKGDLKATGVEALLHSALAVQLQGWVLSAASEQVSVVLLLFTCSSEGTLSWPVSGQVRAHWHFPPLPWALPLGKM